MKYFFALIFFSFPIVLFSETEEEIIVMESNWLFMPSIDEINQDEIEFYNSHHFKELLNLSSGVWISRGSGQESLISLRSPVLTGSGACGSFQILEDGIPIRPAGFCNVNNLFEVSGNLASSIEVVKGPSSSMFGGNALHGAINVKSLNIFGDNNLNIQTDKNESLRTKFLFKGFENTAVGFELENDQGFRNQSGFDQQKIVLKNLKDIEDWSLQTLISLTNLNQETAGYINSYLHPIRIENINPEAYREANSLRINTLAKKKFNDFFISIRPYMRFSSMEFIQHYLPGKPIEKNGQKSLGLFFKLEDFKLNENFFHLGGQIELALVNLDEFQPEALTTSSAFNNAVRPQGFHYDFEVVTNLLAFYFGQESLMENDFKFFSNIRLEILEYDYDNLMSDGRLKDDGTACGFGGCFYSRPSDTKVSFEDYSYRIGIEKKLDKGSFYLQFSKGHRPPQINELFRLQKSQSLAQLNSETIESIEIAILSEGTSFSNQVVFYYSKKKNYIFKDSDSSMAFGGKSRHKGIEIKGSKTLNNYFLIKYAFNLAGHYYDFTNQDIGVLSGNEIDTSPNIFGSIFINFNVSNKLNFELEQEFMDEYFTEPTNTYVYKGHNLTNLRTVYELSEEISLNLSVLNIFDKEYAERADYSSFTGERFFPGIPLKWRLGINYKFN